MSLSSKNNSITLVSLFLGLGSLFFCSCGVLVALSFPLGSVDITSVDTSIFTPELSFLTGVCVAIPGFVLAVAGIGIWFGFGRLPLQRQLTQALTQLDQVQELTLQTCMDQINQLMLEKKLNHSEQDAAAVQLTQRRISETLKVLDPARQQQLRQFLKDSQLVGEKGTVRLEELTDSTGHSE